MALSCKAGTFAVRTTTGSQSVTGVGFQPKAVIFFGDGQSAADGALAGMQSHVGFASGASEEFSYAVYITDGVATSVSSRRRSTSAALNIYDGSSSERNLADLTSFDADGFTLNFTEVSGIARLVHYFALGGGDLSNARVGTFTPAAATGNQSVTGVGFQPDCVLFVGTFADGTTAPLGIGVATTNDQWAIATADRNGQATMDTRRRQVTNACISVLFGADTPSYEASLVSMDSDGFTLNWSVANAQLVGYLALKGGQFKSGSISQKTSTGTQAYAGVGFQPVGLLLASCCNAPSADTQTHARMSLGGASGATARAACWFGSTDDVPDSIVDSATSQTVAITMQTEGTPDENARADLDSFNSDGFTLDWEAADATAREVAYLAFGNAGAAVARRRRPFGGMLRGHW